MFKQLLPSKPQQLLDVLTDILITHLQISLLLAVLPLTQVISSTFQVALLLTLLYLVLV